MAESSSSVTFYQGTNYILSVSESAIKESVGMMANYNLVPSCEVQSVILTEKNNNLNDDIKRLEGEKEAKENDLKAKENDLKAKENDLKALIKENGKLLGRIEQLEKDKKSLDGTIKRLEKKKDDLEKSKDCSVVVAERDSLKNDTTVLHKSIRELEKKDTTLNNTINLKTEELKKVKEEYNDYKNDHQLAEIIKEPWIFAPSIALIISLIISITMISLKRGLTFTKGNTSICLGEKKKTRTKKAD